jgi:hypothetical protein
MANDEHVALLKQGGGRLERVAQPAEPKPAPASPPVVVLVTAFSPRRTSRSRLRGGGGSKERRPMPWTAEQPDLVLVEPLLGSLLDVLRRGADLAVAIDLGDATGGGRRRQPRPQFRDVAPRRRHHSSAA